MTVHCPCCFRSEERTGGRTVVLRAGGARRPDDPARDAWVVVSQSLAGRLGVIAGPCPGCGQPLVGDPGVEPAAYRLPLGDVELTLGADLTLRGPAGVLSVAEAAALVDAAAPRFRPAPLLGMVQTTMLALMVVPFLVWALAVVVVVVFLARRHRLLTTDRERWAARVLDVVPLLLAAWVVARVLPVWLERMTYPYDLEWMEGGMLAHAWRLARGLPIYATPSPDWSPYIYPPGYAALLAAIGGPDGLTYGLGRGVSIAGTLAAAAAIVQLARLAVGTRGWVPGLVGAACFLGTYRASGGFFDLVRPDGLATALWSWAIVFAADRRRGADVTSGLLLCAAYLVKHPAAATGFPILIALLVRDGWRSAARFVAASAVPAGLLTLMLQWRTEGRFLEYLVGVPRSHPIVWMRIVPGAPGELGVWLLIAILASAGLLFVSFPYKAARVPPLAVVLPSLAIGAWVGWTVLQGPRVVEGTPPASAAVLFVTCATFAAAGVVTIQQGAVTLITGARVWRWWLAAGVGGTTLLVGGLMRGHFGGFMNVLMPVHWCLCAGLAVAAGYVRASWPGLPVHATSALLLAAQVGFIGRRLDLDAIVPTTEDREAIAGLTDLLRTCPEGPILSPQAAWAPVLVGRPPSTPLIAWWDLNHHDSPFRGAIGTMGRAAQSHYWSCVLIGGKEPVKLGANGHIDLDAWYEPVPGVVFPKALRTKTGWRVTPRALLVPREEHR